MFILSCLLRKCSLGDETLMVLYLGWPIEHHLTYCILLHVLSVSSKQKPRTGHCYPIGVCEYSETEYESKSKSLNCPIHESNTWCSIDWKSYILYTLVQGQHFFCVVFAPCGRYTVPNTLFSVHTRAVHKGSCKKKWAAQLLKSGTNSFMEAEATAASGIW